MKGTTKKEMLAFRNNGMEVIRIQLKKHPVQNENLQKQIQLNIERFEKHASLMKRNQLKADLKMNFRELLNVVQTIKLISEEPETVLSMLSMVDDKLSVND